MTFTSIWAISVCTISILVTPVTFFHTFIHIWMKSCAEMSIVLQPCLKQNYILRQTPNYTNMFSICICDCNLLVHFMWWQLPQCSQLSQSTTIVAKKPQLSTRTLIVATPITEVAIFWKTYCVFNIDHVQKIDLSSNFQQLLPHNLTMRIVEYCGTP